MGEHDETGDRDTTAAPRAARPLVYTERLVCLRGGRDEGTARRAGGG